MNSNNATNLGTASSQNSDEEARLDIQGTRLAVTRISRRAVLLAAVFGGSLGLVVLMLGFGDHSPPKRDGHTDEASIRPTGPIESVRNLPQDYSFDVTHLAATYEKPTTSSTRPSGPSPQDQALAQALRELAEQRRKLLDQQQKEQQAALDSPLVFGGARAGTSSSGSATSTGPTTMPTVVVLGPDGTAGRWHEPWRVLTRARSVSAPLDTAGDGGPSQQQQKEAFLTQAASVEPYLSKPILTPISKYELKAGSVIPGALLTAINTDLPGEVIGQVTENVFDSATGNYLLIPQGSKLLGKYQSEVANGQNRALVVWQRLIYPNGNSIVLDGMPGTDEAGMSGLQDQVDYHADKLAEATALSTAIAYAGNLARNPQSSTTNGQDVIGDSVAQQANRIGEKIIDKQLDVQPTITIRTGWPLRVLVTKDMVLAPYSG